MLVILLALVCSIAALDKCEIQANQNKLIRPKISLQQGAKFISEANVTTAEQCYQDCCSINECDAALHTLKKTNKGFNCFLFDCQEHCVIVNSTTNTSVFIVSRSEKDLPGNEVKIDSKPISVSNNSIGDQPEENVMPNKTSISVQSASKPTPTKSETNEVLKVEKTETPNKIVTKPDNLVVNNTTVPHTKPETMQPIVNQTKNTAHKAGSKETSSKPTENPKDKTTLPNEVPAVKKPKSKPEKKPSTILDETIKDVKTDSNDSSKTEVTNNEDTGYVIEGKDDETDVPDDHQLKVEVDITKTNSSGYTKNDLIFWVAVFVGSSLILLGLISLIRVYSNKRRRLYSSLTDDYLINGMYSI